MKNLVINLIFGLLLSCGNQAISQTDSVLAQAPKPARFSLQGYLKNLQTISFTSQKGSLTTGELLHNRLNARYIISPTLSARLEFRTRIFWGEQVRQIPDFAGLADYENGLMDLSWSPVEAPALVCHTIADRFSLNWQFRRWDITLGRQRINWGLSNAWNPNDLFNAYNFLDFDYEERPGSDALRVRYSSTGMSGFDFALSSSKNASSTTVALLYRFNRGGYDFQALGAWYKDAMALGAGWAGSIGNAGFKGEVCWFQSPNHLEDSTSILSLSLDGNYTFEDGWYVGTALLYSSGGKQDVERLEQLSTQQLSAKMLMPFKYSLLAQSAKQITPLFTINLSLIYCPGPDALIIFPMLTYSLSDNWNLDIVAQSFFISKEKGLRNEGNSLILRLKWGF